MGTDRPTTDQAESRLLRDIINARPREYVRSPIPEYATGDEVSFVYQAWHTDVITRERTRSKPIRVTGKIVERSPLTHDQRDQLGHYFVLISGTKARVLVHETEIIVDATEPEFDRVQVLLERFTTEGGAE